LLSGEALHLDVKRMEIAYHEHNKRELEMTAHVSLRRLDPLALLTLKATGACQVTIPEWYYDLHGAGQYMRRIKSVSLSIPCVTGPYTGVNCTLSLINSTLRKSSALRDDQYMRAEGTDDRFIDYYGAVQTIVTSHGNNDSGLFETNLRDERLLPFEGAGAESTWKLSLPTPYRQFDYNTISDIILHVKYTARSGGERLEGKANQCLKEILATADASNLLLLFSLPHDFPTEWQQFTSGTQADPVSITIRPDYFPYLTQGRTLEISDIRGYAINDQLVEPVPFNADLKALTDQLADNKAAILRLSFAPPSDPQMPIFLIVRYTLGSERDYT